MIRLGLILALFALGSPAFAQDETRPQARPATVTDTISTRTAPLDLPTTPQARPASVVAFAAKIAAPQQSLRPNLRPDAIRVMAEQQRAEDLRGQVCGNPDIQGEVIGAISGRGRCGVDAAVRLRSVSGVTLATQPTIDCATAKALNTWVRNTAAPAVGEIGGGIKSLRVVSHYACRNRNSASSGRLSEHAFGRAIDIAGIGTRDGGEITLLTDWGSGAKGTALRQMWRGACGPFGTVLGPEANRFHRDHFHFDTARYRSGSYCR